MNMRKLAVLLVTMGLSGTFGGCSDVSVDGAGDEEGCSPACVDGMVCVNKECVVVGNNVNLKECSQGDTKCNATGYFVCKDDKWSKDDSCDDDCYKARCNGDELGQCQVGETMCTQDGVYTCEDGDWSKDVTCDDECYTLKCGGGGMKQCQENETKCATDGYYKCAEGNWVKDELCDDKCFNDRCNGGELGECQDNGTKCATDGYYECIEGNWVKDELCDDTCVNDRCNVVEPEQCQENETKCGVDGYYECIGGNWVKDELCDDTCVNDRCNVVELEQCQENETKCGVDGYYDCIGGNWVKDESCEDDCYKIKCEGEYNECKGGETKCASDGYYICKDNSWNKDESCDEKCIRMNCGECDNDADCASVCNKVTHLCVECNVDDDCKEKVFEGVANVECNVDTNKCEPVCGLSEDKMSFKICDVSDIAKYRELNAKEDNAIENLIISGKINCDEQCSGIPTQKIKYIIGEDGATLIVSKDLSLAKPIFIKDDTSNVLTDLQISHLKLGTIDEPIHFKDVYGSLANEADNIGLFDIEYNVNIDNSKEADDLNSLGGLIGSISNVTVVDVNSYSLNVTAQKINGVGGLFGRLYGKFNKVDSVNITTGKSESQPSHANIVGRDFVGGLVGIISANTISEDYSSDANSYNYLTNIEIQTDSVKGNNTVGGVVGQAWYTNVRVNSVVNNVKYINALEERAAGFMAHLNHVTLAIDDVLNVSIDKSTLQENDAYGIVSKNFAAGFISEISLNQTDYSKCIISNVRSELSLIETYRDSEEDFNASIGAAGFISQINVSDDSNAQLNVSKIISSVEEIKGNAEVAGFISKVDFGSNNNIPQLRFFDIFSSSNVYCKDVDVINEIGLGDKLYYRGGVCSKFSYTSPYVTNNDEKYCYEYNEYFNYKKYGSSLELNDPKNILYDGSNKVFYNSSGFVSAVSGDWFLSNTNFSGRLLRNNDLKIIIPNINDWEVYSSYSARVCLPNDDYTDCRRNNGVAITESANVLVALTFGWNNFNTNLLQKTDELFSKLVFENVVVKSELYDADDLSENMYAKNQNNIVYYIEYVNERRCSERSVDLINAMNLLFDGLFYYTIFDNSKSDEMYRYNPPVHKCWYNDYHPEHLNVIYDKICASWKVVDENDNTLSCDAYDVDKKNFSKDATTNCVTVVDGSLKQELCDWTISEKYNALPIPNLLGHYVNN